MVELHIISRCPSCGGGLTPHDIACDMHLDGYNACGAGFATDWIPEVEYDQEALGEESSS